MGTRLPNPAGIDPSLPPERLVILLVDQLDQAAIPGAFAWLHRETCQGHGLDGCTCVVHLITYQTVMPQ